MHDRDASVERQTAARWTHAWNFKKHWAALSLFAMGRCILCTSALRYRLEHNPPPWEGRLPL